MNRLISSTEIETVIVKLPKNKSPGQNDFKDKFYQTYREELKLIFLKFFHTSKKKEKSGLI